jgi:1,4-dihydroxy-2-naphthoate polyprenyltransferase
LAQKAILMNPTQYKTLHRNDVNFDDYLWGAGLHKKQNTIPLPIETMNLGTSDETVTFQVFQKSEITKPSLLKFISVLVKLPSFILILMPLFYVLVKNLRDNRFRDPFSMTLSAGAMLFLYAGLNIRNDISDHISGYDRVNKSKTDKAIPMGWITALQSSVVSWTLMVVSMLIALPIFILQPELLRVLGFVVILFLLGQFIKKNSYKSDRFGEIILFLLSGPGVVLGYQVSLGAGVDTESIAFGLLWGFAVLFLIHINNFNYILTSSQAHIENTITRMGFDKAQKFLIFWWSAYCALWLVFHLYYGHRFWTISGTLLLVLMAFPLFKQILKIKSPLSSDLGLIRQQAYRNFLVMVFILFAENFWTLGVKLNWTL